MDKMLVQQAAVGSLCGKQIVFAGGHRFCRLPRSMRGGVRLHAAQQQQQQQDGGSGVADPDLPPVSIDPEGLFADKPMGGHFARRESQGTSPRVLSPPPASGASSRPPSSSPSPSVSAADLAALPPIRPLPADLVARGGVPADKDLPGVYCMSDIDTLLRERYVPLDLGFPGLRVLHLDPPVLTVDDFLTEAQARGLIAAAAATGLMKTSLVGAGYADASTAASSASSSGATLNSRRTSTSMLLQPDLLASDWVLGGLVEQLHERGRLIMNDPEPWGAPGKLPLPGQYCYEACQVAQYTEGQYFLEHEDAFDVPTALSNGFNRSATLLVYLNDVPEGGATHFDVLGLSSCPQRGKALIFFPAFSDGTPDARTLHTAQPAVDTKWVSQQWIARGVQSPADMLRGAGGSSSSSASTAQAKRAAAGKGGDDAGPAIEKLVASNKRKGKAAAKGKGKAKGFGAR